MKRITSPYSHGKLHGTFTQSLFLEHAFLFQLLLESSLQKLDLCLAFLDTPKPQNGKEMSWFNPRLLEWQVLPGRNVTHELCLCLSRNRPSENPCTAARQGMEQEGHSSWDQDPQVSVQLRSLELGGALMTARLPLPEGSVSRRHSL